MVAPAKLIDYLLNDDHSGNGGKAAFFLRVGFTRDTWRELAEALRDQARSAEVAMVVASRHGTKYIIDAPLRTPSHHRPAVRSVWICDRGGGPPRLVTAYPIREDAR